MYHRSNRFLFNHYDAPGGAAAPPRRGLSEKLKALWVTSVRDIGGDEMNGKVIRTAEGEFYMMGLLEAFIRRTHGEKITGAVFGGAQLAALRRRPCRQSPEHYFGAGGGRREDLVKSLLMLGWVDDNDFLEKNVELVGIVTDDTVGDLARRRLSSYPLRPTPGNDWIHPLSLRCGPDGGRAVEITHHLPSDYRSLSPCDLRRAGKKERFEDALYELKLRAGADIIILDHAMFIVEHLLRKRGCFGFVLNVHPAITDLRHPHACRGAAPTQWLIEKARRSPEPVTTGATVHAIDEGIDTGPPLVYSDLTNVYPDDSPQQLRFRNYPAKIITFTVALQYYAETIFPRLRRGGLDLSAAVPTVREVSLLDLLGSAAPLGLPGPEVIA